MRVHVLEREQRIPGPPERVFPFFEDAHNLEAITPPFLGFRVVTPAPIAMREGARIEYRLKLHGVPVRWRTTIEQFDPPHMFVDRQTSGPYRLWHHTHVFEPDGRGGTIMRDRVRYALPLGPLGSIAHVLLVRRDLRRIFDYRQAKVAAELDFNRT
jgi:ligand-binding SRPBCC domain-containing protein